MSPPTDLDLKLRALTLTVERLARRAHLFADLGQMDIARQALSDIANALCLPVNRQFVIDDEEEETPLLPIARA